jgi:hypothetical protein
MLRLLLRDLLTDEYGQSYDLISVLACIGYALGIALYTIKCFHHIEFSMIEYGGGFSTLLAATAAARRIQPPAIPNTPTIPASSPADPQSPS